MKTLVLAAVILLTACASEQTVSLVPPAGDPVVFKVEVADTPETRGLGLMHRTELPPGTGMLFIFEEEKPLSFWMKNTLIPLDIFYFTATGALVSRTTMTPCRSDSCPSYPSEGPAKYALEVPAGTGEKHKIGTGWQLVLE